MAGSELRTLRVVGDGGTDGVVVSVAGGVLRFARRFWYCGWFFGLHALNTLFKDMCQVPFAIRP
jgi:cytosine/uracil/thiamine/allantoin permease